MNAKRSGCAYLPSEVRLRTIFVARQITMAFSLGKLTNTSTNLTTKFTGCVYSSKRTKNIGSY